MNAGYALPLKSDFCSGRWGYMFEAPLKSLASQSTEGPMNFNNSHLHKLCNAAKIQVVPFVATL